MLIRFKETDDREIMMKAVFHKTPVEFIKMVKEVDVIKINNTEWKYCDTIFYPSFDDEHVDCVDVFVELPSYELEG